jgi:hypothetical protein
VTQLLGADVHQQIFDLDVVTVETLDRVPHGGGQLAVGPTELLQEHVAETRVGSTNLNGVHELLDVVIHANVSS